MHTWLIEWVPVRPVRSDVTVIIVSAGDEGFGRVPCLDSRKRLGTVGEKCSHTPPSIRQQLWPLLSGFVWKWYVWWRKGTSPTPLPQRDPSSFCYSTLALRTSATLQMFTFLFPSLDFFLSFSLLLLLSRVSWPLPFLPLHHHHHHLYCWIQTGYLYLSAWLLHLPLP